MKPTEIFRPLTAITAEEVKEVLGILFPVEEFEIGPLSPVYSRVFVQINTNTHLTGGHLWFRLNGTYGGVGEQLQIAAEEKKHEVGNYLYSRRLDIFGFIQEGKDIELSDLPKPNIPFAVV